MLGHYCIDSILSLREELDRQLDEVKSMSVMKHKEADYFGQHAEFKRGRESLDKKEAELLTDINTRRRRIVERNGGQTSASSLSSHNKT